MTLKKISLILFIALIMAALIHQLSASTFYTIEYGKRITRIQPCTNEREIYIRNESPEDVAYEIYTRDSFGDLPIKKIVGTMLPHDSVSHNIKSKYIYIHSIPDRSNMVFITNTDNACKFDNIQELINDPRSVSYYNLRKIGILDQVFKINDLVLFDASILKSLFLNKIALLLAVLFCVLYIKIWNGSPIFYSLIIDIWFLAIVKEIDYFNLFYYISTLLLVRRLGIIGYIPFSMFGTGFVSAITIRLICRK